MNFGVKNLSIYPIKRFFFFLDTRTEGNPEAWPTIRAAIDTDES